MSSANILARLTWEAILSGHIAEIRHSVDTRIMSVNKKSKFLKFAKRLIEAKEDTDTIRGLEQKIQNVVVEFQVRMMFAPRSISALF
jgi:hypothetical protein